MKLIIETELINYTDIEEKQFVKIYYIKKYDYLEEVGNPNTRYNKVPTRNTILRWNLENQQQFFPFSLS